MIQMINVIFNGLIRSNHHLKTLQLEANTLGELMREIRKIKPDITQKEFDQAVIFINGNHVRGLRREKKTVHAGDTVIFTNYVGGG